MLLACWDCVMGICQRRFLESLNMVWFNMNKYVNNKHSSFLSRIIRVA